MSLSWRERRTVLVLPDAVRVAAAARFGKRAASAVTWGCAPQGWESAVTRLTEDVEIGPRGTHVSIVLSNRFCQYVLVEVPKEIAGQTETRAYVHNRVQSLYGDAVKATQMAVSAAGDGMQLACCMPTALLDALRVACEARGVEIVSIQPYLTALWNAQRAALPGDAGWLVVHEPKRVVAALVSNGAWLRIAARRCGDSLDEVLDVLDRERELVPEHHDVRTLWMHAPALDAPAQYRDYEIAPIEGRGVFARRATEEATYALAA